MSKEGPAKLFCFKRNSNINFTLRKYEDLRYCTSFPVQIYIYQCYKKSIKLPKTMELNRRPQHRMALNLNPQNPPSHSILTNTRAKTHQ